MFKHNNYFCYFNNKKERKATNETTKKVKKNIYF